MNKKSKLTLKLLLALASAMICLTFLECASRIYVSRDRNNLEFFRAAQPRWALTSQTLTLIDLIRPSSNPNLVFDSLPNQRGIYMGVPVRISAQGLRDRQYETRPPDGVFRLAVLGDSLTFGHGVLLEQIYLKVLETKLNEFSDSTRYEIMNFGVSGYNTVMELETYRQRVRPFQPDAVILQFTPNDLKLPNFVSHAPNPWSLRESFLFNLLTQNVGQLTAAPHMDEDDPNIADKVPAEYRHLVGRENCGAATRQLAHETREDGIPLLWMPGFYHFELLNKTRTCRDDPHYLWLAELCDEEKVPVVDYAADALAFMDRQGLERIEGTITASQKMWLTDSDAHPNAAHHILIAKGLLRALVTNDLIPDAQDWLPKLDAMLSEFDKMADSAFQTKPKP